MIAKKRSSCGNKIGNVQKSNTVTIFCYGLQNTSQLEPHAESQAPQKNYTKNGRWQCIKLSKMKYDYNVLRKN